MISTAELDKDLRSWRSTGSEPWKRLGVEYVILRMQWYGLPQEQVPATLRLFRDEALPYCTDRTDRPW